MLNLPDINSAPLPTNFITAQAMMAELDRETRRMCKRPIPTEPVEAVAEAEMWEVLIAKCDEIKRQSDRIQARAIRECGALLREYGK